MFTHHHVSHVLCHVSLVSCHMWPVTCHMRQFFFWQNGWASKWVVCYQRGVPRLVYIEKNKTKNYTLADINNLWPTDTHTDMATLIQTRPRGPSWWKSPHESTSFRGKSISKLSWGCKFWQFFTESAPLGQFSYRFAMFVCVSVCAIGCSSFRPLIGPEVTWSVPGLSLVLSPSPPLPAPHGNGDTIRIVWEIQCLQDAGF